MASIENRSHYQVTVKNRDDLTKTFPHNRSRKAEEYCQSLLAQKLKPKLSRLDDQYIVRVRQKGIEDQVLHADSLAQAEQIKMKLKVEHGQGMFLNYAKGQNTTLAQAMIRYLWEEAPRNKSFEIEAYKINAMLEDAGLPRQSIEDIIANHPNPCDKVKKMKIRKPNGKKMHEPCSATQFILKPIAHIVPDDFTEYVDERCQAAFAATVDRELDIFSAVCNIAMKTWRSHLLHLPMDGVKRPPVPQRYRDRFVLEIHDIFHRFLERMILPAAIDRWAEKALVRVMPSFFQEYVCGMNAIERLCAEDDDKKRNVSTCSMAPDVRDCLAMPANMKATELFMEKAIGLSFSPSPEGKNYYRSLLKQQLVHYQQDLSVDRLVNGTRLVQFFSARNSLLRPMTSLRDIDQPGLIHESGIDAANKRVSDGMTARAMTFIRRGSGADIDSTDNATEAKS